MEGRPKRILAAGYPQARYLERRQEAAGQVTECMLVQPETKGLSVACQDARGAIMRICLVTKVLRSSILALCVCHVFSAVASPQERQDSEWTKAVSRNNPAAYQQYIKSHPTGSHANSGVEFE